ncbi:skin secretory protein xP2-like [Sarcophilus harrisii]|uniref:skin secretory protein xP2-like n=1 Tax=Sarcophilus harrisii TaxID=9305 RepID=UPI001301E147|nr:skin secretory protein xP2-like [Sarcophilus harrisii]
MYLLKDWSVDTHGLVGGGEWAPGSLPLWLSPPRRALPAHAQSRGPSAPAAADMSPPAPQRARRHQASPGSLAGSVPVALRLAGRPLSCPLCARRADAPGAGAGGWPLSAPAGARPVEGGQGGAARETREPAWAAPATLAPGPGYGWHCQAAAGAEGEPGH